MAKSALELYTDLNINPNYSPGGWVPEVEPMLSTVWDDSANVPPYFGQRRTIMTPTDTIKYNTSHYIPHGKSGDSSGFFLGMDQEDNPIILGNAGFSEDTYFEDMQDDTIINPHWTQDEWIGDYTKSGNQNIKVAGSTQPYSFRAEKDSPVSYAKHKVYKTGEQIQNRFPDIYNKLVELGYFQ